MKQYIRIIGGVYRGKKLIFPDVPGLRPTTDRIKETVFNWLMHDIRNAVCLDAFAGSGSLGFEAFSRGAQTVTLVENSLPIYQQLKKHIIDFKSDQLKLIHSDLQSFIKKTPQEQFDIVFFDPPFSQLFWYESFLTEVYRTLKTGGLLYLESPHKMQLSAAHWHELKSKQAGQVTYSLFCKI